MKKRLTGKEALLKLYIQVEPTNTNIDLTDIIEKDLEVLEIIKKKRVDMSYLYRLQKRNDFTEKQKLRLLNKYNEDKKHLTEREFNLIKEGLER